MTPALGTAAIPGRRTADDLPIGGGVQGVAWLRVGVEGPTLLS